MKHWQLKALVAALSLGAFAAHAQPATSTTPNGGMQPAPPAVDATGRVVTAPGTAGHAMNVPPESGTRDCAGLTGQDMRDCLRAGGHVGNGNDTGATRSRRSHGGGTGTGQGNGNGPTGTNGTVGPSSNGTSSSGTSSNGPSSSGTSGPAGAAGGAAGGATGGAGGAAGGGTGGAAGGAGGSAGGTGGGG